MKSTFQIDGLHTLSISTDPPRLSSQADKFVWIQVDKLPFQTMEQMQNGEAPQIAVVASFGMRPGEARTIASAMMTAAQQAR